MNICYNDKFKTKRNENMHTKHPKYQDLSVYTAGDLDKSDFDLKLSYLICGTKKEVDVSALLRVRRRLSDNLELLTNKDHNMVAFSCGDPVKTSDRTV